MGDLLKKLLHMLLATLYYKSCYLFVVVPLPLRGDHNILLNYISTNIVDHKHVCTQRILALMPNRHAYKVWQCRIILADNLTCLTVPWLSWYTLRRRGAGMKVEKRTLAPFFKSGMRISGQMLSQLAHRIDPTL